MLRSGVDRLPASDTGRLGELYLRHANDAVRLAYLLTGDLGLAEDLVQDAFIRVAGRLVHLRDPGAFDAYLRRTVINLSRSYFRRKLSDRQRVAIVLRFYEDLSERQVADILKCRPGTVKSLVSRGLETLRTQIEGEGR
jgi:DNA-directed RNA polymerase specialized sigma24 family protein